jgi:hypothetical protein
MAKLSVEGVAAKLRECDGSMADVARSFKVTRQAVHVFIERHPALKPVLHDCREVMKDDAEASLYRSVRAEESWAIQFYLKTQAKDRGYIERKELTGADGGPIREVREVVVRTRSEADALLAALPEASPVPR